MKIVVQKQAAGKLQSIDRPPSNTIHRQPDQLHR